MDLPPPPVPIGRGDSSNFSKILEKMRKTFNIFILALALFSVFTACEETPKTFDGERQVEFLYRFDAKVVTGAKTDTALSIQMLSVVPAEADLSVTYDLVLEGGTAVLGLDTLPMTATASEISAGQAFIRQGGWTGTLPVSLSSTGNVWKEAAIILNDQGDITPMANYKTVVLRFRIP